MFKGSHVEVILEDIQDQFKVFGEELGRASQKIDVLDGKMERLEKKMDNGFFEVNDRIDNLEEKMDGVEEKMDGMENRMGGMEGKMERIGDDVSEIKYKLDKKVDRDEFQKLEKRVIRLERPVVRS